MISKKTINILTREFIYLMGVFIGTLISYLYIIIEIGGK